MSRSRLRAGIVGLGAMGRHHVRILSEFDGVDLIAVCDQDPAMLRATSKTSNAEPHGSVETFRRLDLDLVVVAVPTSHHRQIAEELLRPGISLIVEKPLASTVADGEAMVASAARAGARLGVGHIERFNPVVVAARELIATGRLGRPMIFGTRRLGPLPPRVVDVGVIVDLATHDIDVLTSIHGAPVESIQAQAHRRGTRAREDSVTALMRFADGVTAVIEANWITPTKVRQLSVTSEGGMFIGDYLSQELSLLTHAATVADVGLKDVQTLVERRTLDIALVRAEPLRRELEAFTLAARQDHALPVTGEMGLRVLKLAAAMEEAASTGTTVTIRDDAVIAQGP